MRSLFMAIIAATLMVGPAMADDRPMTDQEKASVADALKTQGCSSSRMKFDDGKFEVDDATCADGKRYELSFDQSFKLIKKEEEDRPLTDQEKASLGQAVTAQGCSGGKVKVDDGRFKVDDATCADGKKYEFAFDQSFKLIKKEEDND
jgi:hypothetical protein